jgi:hypothetical protein
MVRSILALLAALAIAVTIGFSIVDAAQLLSNGGFESGTTDWSTYGATLSTVSNPVRSGAQAAAVSHTNTALRGIVQTVTGITGGDTYYLIGYAYRNDSNIDRVLLRIAWYESTDASGSQLSYNDSNELTTDSTSWQSMSSGELTAPGTARSAEVRAYFDVKVSTSATVYFDDLSLTDTPTSITFSSFTTHSTSPQPTSFRWQWLALVGAVVAVGGVAVVRRWLGR